MNSVGTTLESGQPAATDGYAGHGAVMVRPVLGYLQDNALKIINQMRKSEPQRDNCGPVVHILFN